MLTQRQKKLLEIIVNEFMDTAEAVGSIELPRKYGLEVSPATVRNEMAKLVELGYLKKNHASSGRIPTTTAFKYFLQELIDELDEIDIRRKSLLQEDLFQKRFNTDHLMLSSVKALSELTNNASFALVEDKIYHSGLNSLLENPEFQDLDVFKYILAMIEDYSEVSNLLSRYRGESEIKVLIGDELGDENLEDCAIVFADIPISPRTNSYLAVFGPNRMNYRKVIPSIKYISQKIQELISTWRY